MLDETRLVVVLLSLLSALLLGLTGIFTRRGLAHGTLRQSVAVTFGSNVLLMAALSLLLAPSLASIPTGMLLLLVVDGLLAFLAVYFLFQGVARVGPSISYAVKNTSPIPAIVIATLFLREIAAPLVYVGALLAVGGVVALSFERQQGGLAWRPGMLYPVIGALLFALDSVVRRLVMQEFTAPVLAVAISGAIALVPAGLWLLAERKPLVLGPGLAYFALGGVTQGLGLLALYTALQTGIVSIVVPLYTSSPIFVVLLSGVLLRGLERLSLRIVVGALAVVAGVALISLGG